MCDLTSQKMAYFFKLCLIFSATFLLAKSDSICGNLTSCSSCISNTQCGYCLDTGKCSVGNLVGPLSCSSWWKRTCPSCSSYQNCSLCLNNHVDECFWCNSKNSCDKQSSAQCTSSTLFGQSCPITNCSSHTSCSSCTSDPPCGWCYSSNSCFNGNSFGPISGTCEALKWSKDLNTCSPKECKYITSCSSCLATPSCRWCSGSVDYRGFCGTASSCTEYKEQCAPGTNVKTEIGLIIGCVVIMIIIGITTIFCLRKRQQRKYQNQVVTEIPNPGALEGPTFPNLQPTYILLSPITPQGQEVIYGVDMTPADQHN